MWLVNHRKKCFAIYSNWAMISKPYCTQKYSIPSLAITQSLYVTHQSIPDVSISNPPPPAPTWGATAGRGIYSHSQSRDWGISKFYKGQAFAYPRVILRDLCKLPFYFTAIWAPHSSLLVADYHFHKVRSLGSRRLFFSNQDLNWQVTEIKFWSLRLHFLKKIPVVHTEGIGYRETGPLSRP